MRKSRRVSLVSARAGLCGGQVRSRPIRERFDLPDFIMDFTSLLPNKSPEPLWGLSIGMMGLSKSLLDKMFITRSATEWSGVVREAMWLTNP